MVIKEIAYAAQQHLLTGTDAHFKRSHIYELLAAGFGFKSYAALCADSVFTQGRSATQRSSIDGHLVRHRCIEMGYQPDVANAVSLALPAFLAKCQIGIIHIENLMSDLRGKSELKYGHFNDDEEMDHQDDSFDDNWFDPNGLISPILLEGLESAASKGSALAHYALALIHDPDKDGEEEVGSGYWYSQAQQGRILTGVQKEWADNYAMRLVHSAKYAHHLHEAARLGQQDALLERADRFGDPAFFERADIQANSDLAWVAEIAERLGRPDDVKKWLTLAAESGDIEAMRRLIEEYDQGDLLRCWTWFYLADLIGVDLTKDEYYAIHEDGSPYDDDVGGPVFVAGCDGLKLDPISAEQYAAAQHAARELFKRIRRTDDAEPLG